MQKVWWKLAKEIEIYGFVCFVRKKGIRKMSVLDQLIEVDERFNFYYSCRCKISLKFVGESDIIFLLSSSKNE